MLTPRQPAPALAVETVAHGRFDLAAAPLERGAVICFYRGLHCPICASYLKEFEKQVGAFAERGYASLALSSDGEDRARAMAETVGARALPFGYGLSLAAAREWGLYISTSRGTTSIGVEEPALFSEPGLFVINADRTVYYVSVQSMPFVRPQFRELVAALDFAIEKNYPARGEYAGAV